jgi:hypothetical protein
MQPTMNVIVIFFQLLPMFKEPPFVCFAEMVFTAPRLK